MATKHSIFWTYTYSGIGLSSHSVFTLNMQTVCPLLIQPCVETEAITVTTMEIGTGQNFPSPLPPTDKEQQT